VLFSVVTAKADSVTFTIGNNPQPDEENILLNNGTTGAVVFGVTNQTQLQVRFSSTTDVLVEPSSGQARIEATDGLLNNITISIPGGTFHDIILNPFFGSGTANVSVLTTNATFSFAYQLSNGQNFLTIVADPGTLILSVTINAASGFTDLRQPRISGAAVTAVPEPASMVLFGIGLIGTATQLLKRRRHLS
jgi:hypothetical protein